MFALIEQPHYGWGSPVIFVPLDRRRRRVRRLPRLRAPRRASRCSSSSCSRVATSPSATSRRSRCTRASRSCSSSSSSSCSRSPATARSRAASTTLPVTIVMFALSRRFGALADRHGPRLFMGAGPLVAAVGILLLLRTGMDTSYLTDVLPAMLVFALGLVADGRAAHRDRAGRRRGDATPASPRRSTTRSRESPGWSASPCSASSSQSTLVGDTFAPNDESVRAFHQVVVDLRGARRGRGRRRRARHRQSAPRPSRRADCPGGQLVAVPRPAVD